MAGATIVQSAEFYEFEDPEFDSSVAYTNPVVKGNVLVGFTSYRYNGAMGPAPFGDSLSNSFTVLNDPTVNPGGLCNSSSAWAVTELSGNDRVSTPIHGLGIFNVDSNAWELAGVQEFDSAAYFAGGPTSMSPMVGSLTTTTGDVFNFATTTSFPNWFLTIAAFKSTDLQLRTNLVIFVFCTAGTAVGIVNGVSDTVAGWTFLGTDAAAPANPDPTGFNGRYYTTATSQRQQFLYPSGDPVAFGYLLVSQGTDVRTPIGTAMGAGRVSKVMLDENGIGSNFIPFANVDMTPPNTYYLIRVYSAEGELVRGPYTLQVTSSWL